MGENAPRHRISICSLGVFSPIFTNRPSVLTVYTISLLEVSASTTVPVMSIWTRQSHLNRTFFPLSWSAIHCL